MPVRRRLLLFCLACTVVTATAFSQTNTAQISVAGEAGAMFPHGTATALGARVAGLLKASGEGGAHWGIAVTTLEGVPVFGWNEQQLFRPASTAKLFTTAAATALLGPDHRVATSLLGNFDPATGTVSGDLVLAGGGDPSFGTDDLPFHEHARANAGPDALHLLADRLVALGVRKVDGDVVGDDTLFSREPAPEGWAAEDLLWGYGALPSALSIDDNQLRLQIVAGDQAGAGEGDSMARPPVVTVEGRVPWVQVNQNISTLPSGNPTGVHIGVVAENTAPQGIRVFGTMPVGSPPDVERIAIADPAAYAASALRAILLDRGATVSGQARARHTSPDDARSFLQSWRDVAPETTETGGKRCATGAPATQEATGSASTPVLVSEPSAPLREEIVYTLKTSANLHAEVLLRQLAIQTTCPGASAVLGSVRLRQWLLRIGLRERDFFLYDGSGLSAKDLVTPRSETQLLAYAAGQPWFAAWQAALPVGGVDGTLAKRFTAPAMRGRVLAKTGTLGESRALAGYVRCLSGQVLTFSVLVDNHEPGSTTDRATMDALVTAIVETH